MFSATNNQLVMETAISVPHRTDINSELPNTKKNQSYGTYVVSNIVKPPMCLPK